MNLSTELRFAPAVAGMKTFLEPYHPWLEISSKPAGSREWRVRR